MPSVDDIVTKNESSPILGEPFECLSVFYNSLIFFARDLLITAF